MLPGVLLRQAAAAPSAGRTACAVRVPGAAACLCWHCWELFLAFTASVRTLHRWKELVFELKILLGSSWSAPVEGRPQAGGSRCPLVPLRHGDGSAHAE